MIRSLASISGLVSAIGLILVIWFGGKDVIKDETQMGVFIAFLGYMGQLSVQLKKILLVCITSLHEES